MSIVFTPVCQAFVRIDAETLDGMRCVPSVHHRRQAGGALMH